MIDVQYAIDSNNPLVLHAAIEQRKRDRLVKFDFMQRIKSHDYSASIAHTRQEIAVLQQRLAGQEARQRNIPTLLQDTEKEREKLTAEIKRLSIFLPRDVAGKVGKKLAEAGLKFEDLERILKIKIGERDG